MKLNPSKCVFGVPSGRFLGFQVHQRGIEVNPEKIKALEGMASPRTLKDVQRLTGCLASLNRAPILSKPVVGETLYLYLSVTEGGDEFSVDPTGGRNTKASVLYKQSVVSGGNQILAGRKNSVSSDHIGQEAKAIFPSTYNRGIYRLPAETHSSKPEVSGRLTKWAVELSEYDIRYTPKTAIKGQAVSDFIAEFTEPDAEATNNQAEYEALLAGLRVCIALGADELEVYSDSQVVVHQVLNEYQAREEHMIAYLDIAKRLLKKFKAYRISQIPREENEKADALSKLASATTSIRSKAIPVAHLTKQRCISGEKTGEILRSIHSGVCGNHTGGKSLAHKILRQGFYWPTLFAEAQQFAESCETCQRVANDIRRPPELLRSLTSPWPFAMWGLDLIGPMPTGTKGGAKHAIVAVDYFTKWAEAEQKHCTHHRGKHYQLR
ncbi:hypothetical protein LWI29_016138 [Acer saccharum]|uniref:RNase H type-1 domain-containing protein n=1 Tax=Acer saccharum TaxID=4024 RepID=A0AA39VT88_ACESA|nr:hypothetical protein LWI29_016138 [Acer saccharum]